MMFQKKMDLFALLQEVVFDNELIVSCSNCEFEKIVDLKPVKNSIVLIAKKAS